MTTTTHAQTGPITDQSTYHPCVHLCSNLAGGPVKADTVLRVYVDSGYNVKNNNINNITISLACRKPKLQGQVTKCNINTYYSCGFILF